MTSSPERTFRRAAAPAQAQRGFTPASTAPAGAPRVFVAAPAGAGAGARDFTGIELPRTPADAEAVRRVHEAARAAGFAEGWAHAVRQATERAAAEREAERAAAEAAARAHEARRAAALARAEAAVLAAAAGLRERQDPLLGQLADTVLELACDLAGAVLDRELSLVASPVLEAVQRALRPLDPTLPVTVRVHPDDLLALAGDGLKGQVPGADAGLVTYVSDSSLLPGDAVARQGDTDVDARLRASVSRALDALVGAPTAPAASSAEVPGQAA